MLMNNILDPIDWIRPDVVLVGADRTLGGRSSVVRKHFPQLGQPMQPWVQRERLDIHTPQLGPHLRMLGIQNGVPFAIR